MLDVHPPHEAAHTWKDFFIHVATICVGLLIAVGLEQTVEAFHHHHQREELRESLLEDNQKALRDNQEMERASLNQLQWLGARIDDVITALRTNTHPHAIALLPVGFKSVPVDPNWKAAKSSNLVQVLPQQDIKAFSEVDSLIDLLTTAHVASTYSASRIAFEQRFRVSASNDTLDFSTATRDDLVQELSLLSEERSNAMVIHDFHLYLRGCLAAVIRGERDLDRIDDEEDNANDEGSKHRYEADPYRTAPSAPAPRPH